MAVGHDALDVRLPPTVKHPLQAALRFLLTQVIALWAAKGKVKIVLGGIGNIVTTTEQGNEDEGVERKIRTKKKKRNLCVGSMLYLCLRPRR